MYTNYVLQVDGCGLFTLTGADIKEFILLLCILFLGAKPMAQMVVSRRADMSLLPARSGTVNVVPYLTQAVHVSGLVGYNGIREYTTIHNQYRIRQSGTITQVAIGVRDTTDLRELYVRIWRKSGMNSYDSIGQSENLRDSVPNDARKVIVLASPITGVQEGDFVALKLRATSTNPNFGDVVLTDSHVWSAVGGHAATRYAWESQTDVADRALPVECFMSPPRFAFIGHSHTASNAGFCNASSAYCSFLASFPHEFEVYGEAALPATTITYQNMGIGGDNTTQILARVKTDLTALLPTYGVILVGVTDINQGTSTTTIEANYQAILDSCRAYGIKPITVNMCPWTKGTNAQMQQSDSIWTWLQTQQSTYCTILANPRSYVGQFRAGGDANNLWDIQATYDARDSLHFNSAGYQQIAKAVWDAVAAAGGGSAVSLTPIVTTAAATGVGTTSGQVTLNGSICAINASTTGRFVYGTSSGIYPDSVTATQSPVTGWPKPQSPIRSAG